MDAKAAALGGTLGTPVANVELLGEGHRRQFQNGAIYFLPERSSYSSSLILRITAAYSQSALRCNQWSS
jgi:uncharacterized protein with LGFP repeats